MEAPGLLTDEISTLAPREGSDRERQQGRHLPRHFNPRSPRGERRSKSRSSTSPLRISTLAPREGSDPSSLT